MLPPNSIIPILSLTGNRQRVFPNLLSVSNKPQHSAKIQPDKLISPLSLQQLEPSTSSTMTQKSLKARWNKHFIYV